ncbi:MAG TPA: hypothetical protein VK324_08365, partial [Tepidisphaeraceae bacterium]|nr:hypothetical protein [Tepidisphaeraceae bacterium]
MSRKSKRISRALIGLLLCTIVLGIAFYARNATRGRPAANAVELARPPVTPPAKADAAPAVAKAPDGPAGAATVDAPAKPLVITTSLPIGPAASQQPAFAAPDAPAGRAVAVQTSTAQPPAAPSTRPADAGPLVIGGVPAPAPVPARVSLSATPLADAQAQLDNGQL